MAKKEPTKTRKHRIPSFPDIPPEKKNINPGNDFYTFVNGNWIDHIHMPAFKSSYSVSDEIESKINNELFTVLKTCQRKVQTTANKELSDSVRILGTFTQSGLHTQSQKNSVKFLKSMVSSLKCMRDTNDLADTLGTFVKYNITSILTVFTSPRKSKSNNLYLSFAKGSLGLPDTSYYLDKTHDRTIVLTKYADLLKRLGEEFDVPNMENCVHLESMAAKQYKLSQYDDDILVNGAELSKKYCHIPWARFAAKAFGFTEAEWKKKDILILSNYWIKCVNTWFHTVTLDQWKIWLSASLILYALPNLPPPFDDWHFDLFHRKLRGQNEKTPQNKLVLYLAENFLKANLGKEFIKRHVSINLKKSITTLVEEIRNVAMDRMLEIDWFEPKTRELARKKIKQAYFGIAYPNKLKTNSDIKLLPDNLISNIFELGKEQLEDELELANTTLKPEVWTDSVFAVNAYYYDEGNRLILPAGILRWPFFHVAASDGWNFGGIGATFGHELTHAFDMDGKNYDLDGNRNPWWTPNDNRHYNKKVKNLISLYNSTHIYNHPINGLLTLSENIADLGGVAIALSALKKRLEKRKVTAEQRKKELQQFFVSYAVSWRSKDKKEKVLQSLFMDPHSPSIARVNNIVCHFDDWYEIFDIKLGDILYMPPEKRIRIF